MIFPDPLDKPSRTIITGEGGKSPSRFKHVIQTPKGFRRLRKFEGNVGIIKDKNERAGLKTLFRNQAALEINNAYVKMLDNINKN